MYVAAEGDLPAEVETLLPRLSWIPILQSWGCKVCLDVASLRSVLT